MEPLGVVGEMGWRGSSSRFSFLPVLAQRGSRKVRGWEVGRTVRWVGEGVGREAGEMQFVNGLGRIARSVERVGSLARMSLRECFEGGEHMAGEGIALVGENALLVF